MKCCIRHMCPPDGPLDMEEVGDCTMCVPDENNKECKMYYAITIAYYTVKEKEDAIR